MTALMLLAGAGFGIGIAALWRGLFPPKPTLAEALTSLRPAPATIKILDGTESDGWATRMGRPAVGLLLNAGFPGAKVSKDLVILERGTRSHLAEKAVLAMAGLVLVPVFTAVLSMIGIGLPWAVPAWGALACAVGGFLLPDLSVKAEAAERRQEFRLAFTAFLDMVCVGLSGGAGVEAALEQAANCGGGWAFSAIRRALAAARMSRVTPWETLAQLGAELDVPVLGEISATLSLAGSEGARVRASLQAKAEALRGHALSDADAAAQQATERMSLPVTLMFAGFLLFLAFPALAKVAGAV